MLPSQTPVRLLLLWLIGALAASIWPVALQPWLIASGLAAAAALFDLFLLVLLPRPSAERRLPGSAALNVGLDVHLRLHNPAAAASQVEVFDHQPPEGMVVRLRASGRRDSTFGNNGITYPLLGRPRWRPITGSSAFSRASWVRLRPN